MGNPQCSNLNFGRLAAEKAAFTSGGGWLRRGRRAARSRDAGTAGGNGQGIEDGRGGRGATRRPQARPRREDDRCPAQAVGARVARLTQGGPFGRCQRGVSFRRRLHGGAHRLLRRAQPRRGVVGGADRSPRGGDAHAGQKRAAEAQGRAQRSVRTGGRIVLVSHVIASLALMARLIKRPVAVHGPGRTAAIPTGREGSCRRARSGRGLPSRTRCGRRPCSDRPGAGSGPG